MKKLIVVLLTLVLAVALVGCTEEELEEGFKTGYTKAGEIIQKVSEKAEIYITEFVDDFSENLKKFADKSDSGKTRDIPAKPADEPTEPSQPADEPTAPSEEPTEPSAPAEEPTEPSEPAEEPTEPSEPADEPTEEPTEPSEPADEPTEEPTAPAEEPTEEEPAEESEGA